MLPPALLEYIFKIWANSFIITSIERLLLNRGATETDVEKIYPGETNRCFVESLIRVQQNQKRPSSITHGREMRREIQQNCETCQLLSFKDSHLQIPLIRLMFSSISCRTCHILCQAIILLEQDWLKTGHSSSILDIERRQGMLCFQVQNTEGWQETLTDRSKSRRGLPLIMHIFSQQELGQCFLEKPTR